MKSDVTLRFRDGVGVISIARPPVNAITRAMVQDFATAIEAFEADKHARALLIYCEGRTFVAGGDIASFEDPGFSAAPFNDALARLEGLDRPVVAAMHGTVLGAGLELALACHYRVADPRAVFGLPEVKLGLLPGSLGTQRLPRLVGLSLALDLISTGRSIDSPEALKTGLIDVIREGLPLQAGLDYVRELVERAVGPKRLSEQRVMTEALPPDFFRKAREAAIRLKPFNPAPRCIVQALEASLRPFAEGATEEARLFEVLRLSPESQAMRHLFLAERRAAKIPELPQNAPTRPVRSAGVLGAGTMGIGIAMNFSNVGIPVVLVETSRAALTRALDSVRGIYVASAIKGRLTQQQVAQRVALITGSLDDQALAPCDLVIEAVYESLELKKAVCARLGQLCKAGAIIATNTSTLNVDVLAEATGRPGDVVGMHFFSPAHVMRLLEVVRAAHTRPEVLATAVRLACAIGKVPVVSGVCYGFIGNRMAEVYMREAEFLMMEGAAPSEIDAAVESLGMAMGPCRMLDMAGIDVGAKTVIEYGKSGGLPPDDAYRAVVRRMFELGRFGQKSGAGYYRYEGRIAFEDPEAQRIVSALADLHGISRRASIEREEIAERLLYPLFNEGARILEEGIAYRPGDIDIVWTRGYGFPEHRGGPMFMADLIGLRKIVDRMALYGRQCGNRYGYWNVSPLLARLAATGGRLSDWRQES
jgi:3-hydroxyacyl-CoA dehydrogenase